MKLLFLATAGGAIGAGARYLVNVGVARWLGGAFPWSTLIVNVVGCGLMGVLYWCFIKLWPEQEAMRIFLATGILGGFTTFSAYALDFWVLLERDAPAAAALYLVGTVITAALAFIGGLALAKVLLT